MSGDPLARGADEMIIGIPREAALNGPAWSGLRRFEDRATGDHEIARLQSLSRVRPRRELERDPLWKQPIPYAVAIYRAEGATPALFWMDRLEGGSDRRLHGRSSFGVGGHVGAEDGGILAALHREWEEEVATPIPPRFTPLGLLNDDSDDVGRVHLGIVFVAELSAPQISIRETTKLAGRLIAVEEAAARAPELEGWSARLIAPIVGLVNERRP